MGRIARWKKIMFSENETKYRNSITNKLSILIVLWILDKIIMLLMLMLIK